MAGKRETTPKIVAKRGKYRFGMDPLRPAILYLFGQDPKHNFTVEELHVRLSVLKGVEQPVDMHAVIWWVTRLKEYGKLIEDNKLPVGLFYRLKEKPAIL